MYAQSFFVTSVRGMPLLPTTAPSAALGCIGFMKAAFGLRLAPPFFLAPPRFFALFFAPFRFFAAILSPGRWNGIPVCLRRSPGFPYENRAVSEWNSTISPMERKPVPKNAREGKPDFPYENVSFVGVTLTTRERVFHRRNDLGALPPALNSRAEGRS